MIKIQYIAIKEQSKPFRVVNSKLFKGELDQLPAGRYRVTVEKYRKNKSNPQLAWLYGQIYPLVLQGLIDAGWDEVTNLDQVDAMMKDMFAKTEIVNKHTGEIMDIPGLKRNMTTVEMMTYVDAIRDWASEYLNVIIPEPETQTNFNFKTNE
jgi:hypothetical protein